MGRVITLTTDFGAADGYVAAMKGVILGIAPETVIVDISHDVPPQDVAAGSFVLASAYRYFPQGTIHVAVVDPGVGSDRRPIAVATADAVFVAPDNGLLSFLWTHASHRVLRAVELCNSALWLPEVSATFHGRDIFAPVAAHLARSVALADLGPALPVSSLVSLPAHRFKRRGDIITGAVLHIDRFGNVITNVPGAALRHADRLLVEIAGRRLGPLRRAYADVAGGQFVILIGSAGFLEVALNGGNAAEKLGVAIGALIRVHDGIPQP